jgi:c-di-GMP-binding flagellar brake protein YcgR
MSRYSVERKYARYSLDVRAKLSAGEREITVRTLDISEGGVGLVSPVEIPEGSSFVVEFELPTVPGTFRAELKARSKVGFRYGFIFANVDESSMALFRKYQRRWGILAKDDYAARD